MAEGSRTHRKFVRGGAKGPGKSMKDMGVDSLDMVEIVSACMRELRIKVPRSELTVVKDVASLVDLLHDAQAPAPAAEARSA